MKYQKTILLKDGRNCVIRNGTETDGLAVFECFNPALKAEGKNPFTLTSKEGDGTYQAFLNNETRYSALTRKFPERAKVLFDRNEQAAKARFEHLQKLVELYK